MSRTLSLLPPWTKSDDETGSPIKSLSENGKIELVRIESLFCEANENIRRSIEEEIGTLEENKNSALGPKTGVYNSRDYDRVIEYLSDVSYLNIWKATVKYLLKDQGYNSAYQMWDICKQTALDFLELREDIVRRFGDVQRELRNLGLHELCESILLKVQTLKRFEVVYNRQPSPTGDYKPPPEPTFITGTVPKWNTRVVEAYSRTNDNQKQNPTLIAILSITTAISMIPLILSWRVSANVPGTTSDVDFYLLIQNPTMQLLGLFMAIYPIARRSGSSAWQWAQVLTAAGAACAIAAIPMYLYLPTMWSALMTFFASIAQAIMTLELVLMAGSTVRSAKEE